MENDILSSHSSKAKIVPFKRDTTIIENKINRRGYKGIQKGNDINNGLYTSIDGQSYSSIDKAIMANKEKFRQELGSKKDL